MPCSSKNHLEIYSLCAISLSNIIHVLESSTDVSRNDSLLFHPWPHLCVDKIAGQVLERLEGQRVGGHTNRIAHAAELEKECDFRTLHDNGNAADAAADAGCAAAVGGAMVALRQDCNGAEIPSLTELLSCSALEFNKIPLFRFACSDFSGLPALSPFACYCKCQGRT